jgi:hypothetical protein
VTLVKYPLHSSTSSTHACHYYMHATCKTCNSILITFINSLSTPLLPPLTARWPLCLFVSTILLLIHFLAPYI